MDAFVTYAIDADGALEWVGEQLVDCISEVRRVQIVTLCWIHLHGFHALEDNGTPPDVASFASCGSGDTAVQNRTIV